jgi:hypothetical protein
VKNSTRCGSKKPSQSPEIFTGAAYKQPRLTRGQYPEILVPNRHWVTDENQIEWIDYESDPTTWNWEPEMDVEAIAKLSPEEADALEDSFRQKKYN